jgi:hypothetical protein
VPKDADGIAVVVIVIPLTTLNVSVLSAVVPPLSVTRTITLLVPAAVGVPIIAPRVVELRVNPAGRLLEIRLNVYGLAPPVACNVARGLASVYTFPSVAAGIVVVVMESGAPAAIVRL